MLAGLHHRDKKDGEGKRICTFDLMHVTHPHWLAELCPRRWWGRRVLPWAQRAYETCLSAGSTATLPDEEEWGPHPELHRVPLPTEQAHRSKCFGGAEIGRRETTCTSKAAWF